MIEFSDMADTLADFCGNRLPQRRCAQDPAVAGEVTKPGEISISIPVR
jgi:hypothetical protein